MSLQFIAKVVKVSWRIVSIESGNWCNVQIWLEVYSMHNASYTFWIKTVFCLACLVGMHHYTTNSRTLRNSKAE